jgi:hypothetical protein
MVEMKRIAELTGSELRWVQPSMLKMEYELKVQDEVAATLKFRSSFSSFAVGESGEGSWTFKRVGFWQRSVQVRELASDADLATFTRNIWKEGGSLELNSGSRYLATANFWQNQFDLWTAGRKPLIHYRIGGVWRPSAATLIETGAASLPELPWLTLLGWYLVLMMRRDAAAAA